MRLAEFTLSRKDPGYVAQAKAAVSEPIPGYVEKAIESIKSGSKPQVGSVICANRPGDGSAREQAASCQRVLGGMANIAVDYATKRYRSNLINWGMLPFTGDISGIKTGMWLFVPGIREALTTEASDIKAYLIDENSVSELTLTMPKVTDEERDIIHSGCLINYYKN